MLTRAEAEAAARRTVATRAYADVPELAEPAVAALTEALLDRDRASRNAARLLREDPEHPRVTAARKRVRARRADRGDGE